MLVSGGDSGYFDLLVDLADSIRSKPGGDKLNVHYLDGGLKKEQIDLFEKKYNIKVHALEWMNETAGKRSRGREYLKINTAKLHLDKLFPDSEIIMWVDADAWFQNFNALPLFEMVAKRKKFAVVSQSSRLQDMHLNFKKLFGKYVELRNIIYKNARRAGLDFKLVNNLMARPALNAGAYALHRDAQHWERFRYWQNIVMKKGRVFCSDQLAFGLAIYEDGLPYEALPDICNYMGPWRWCDKTQMFIDYYAPYDPVSIVHMAGEDVSKRDLDFKMDMVDADDNKVAHSLRYRARVKVES